MAWTKLCATGTLVDDGAMTFNVHGVDVLVVKRKGRYLVIPPLCPYMAKPLSAGCFDECFEGDAPKCNKHAQRALAASGMCPGVAQTPIMMYDSKEAGGVIYIDLQRQRLSAYQYISCSPIVGPDGTRALKFNLWSGERGELKETVYGRPRRSPDRRNT